MSNLELEKCTEDLIGWAVTIVNDVSEDSDASDWQYLCGLSMAFNIFTGEYLSDKAQYRDAVKNHKLKLPERYLSI